MRTSRLVFIALLGTASCRSQAAQVESAPPPMDVSGTVDTRWDYLHAKYDANADGAIAAGEYDRGETQFERLDQNSDGVIDASDFESRSSGGGGGGNRGGMRAQFMVARYFQHDDEMEQLALAELREALAAYDSSADGKINLAEFQAGLEARKDLEFSHESSGMQRMMGDLDPWETLIAGVDHAVDDALAIDEVIAFFQARDGNGDDVWMLGQRTRPASSGEREKSGPTVGTIAPDFSLEPPTGGKAVTLSSFAGKKPVALIFGSYT